jgi:hypothetical protein
MQENAAKRPDFILSFVAVSSSAHRVGLFALGFRGQPLIHFVTVAVRSVRTAVEKPRNIDITLVP